MPPLCEVPSIFCFDLADRGSDLISSPILVNYMSYRKESHKINSLMQFQHKIYSNQS